MINAINYPSCIKIPSTNSKQNMTNTLPQQLDLVKALALNNDLILLANQIFGEGKWSHNITSQTIDFIETFMGKYVCGCVTLLKVQLKDGTFHEDMGYCYTEGAMKGLTIHCARIGSLTDAFKRVLSCFGKEINTEVQNVSKKLSNSHMVADSLFNGTENRTSETKMPEPCAQSTPFISKNDKEKQKTEDVLKSKCPNVAKEQVSVRQTVSSSVAQPEQCIKTSSEMKSRVQPSVPGNQKEQSNIEIGDSKSASEEELLRMERKRKQMEKQAEYKRLMKEREQQKTNQNKKSNTRY
ncbi:DNA repair protein RAD52 homolog [Bombus flavifrons]|uniref:DNA repair protein RAD52 homolog n=1 Tax=Bombus flavifrons TaxID=103934 RepID=UPI0037049748